MATWNKIIVSGSQAELAGITGSLLTDDKLLFAKNGGAVTSTDVTVNANGHLEGTFSGSLHGNADTATSASHAVNADAAISASHALNADAAISASHALRADNADSADKVANSLTDGNGIADFTFDGSGAASVSVELDGTTLKVGASGLAVNELGVDTAQLAAGAVTFAKLDEADVIGSLEGLDGNSSNSTLATSQAIVDYVDAQVGGATLNLSGSDGSNDGIDLNDEALTITGESGVISTEVTANTLTISIDNNGITNDKLASSTISGISLGSDLADLTVDNSSLQLNSGTTYNGGTAKTISVKDGGITNDMLEGSIANGKLANDGITFGTADVSLGDTVTQMSLTGFTGSLSSTSVLADGVTATTQTAGDGSTKVATTAYVDNAVDSLSSTLIVGDGSTTTSVDLKNDTLVIAGGSNINTVTGTDTITINLDSDISVTNATITGDLVVQGTASFQHESNLEVADRFILLASGSSATGDGGIIVQQATQDVGEVFGFDGVTGESRWGIGQNQNAASSSFSPEAFMAAVVVGGGSETIDDVDARYAKKGNMFIQDNGEIYIFS